MATWNSWYNPLDNIANVARGVGRKVSSGAEAITTGFGSMATNNPIPNSATANLSTDLATQSTNATRQALSPLMSAGSILQGSGTSVVDAAGNALPTSISGGATGGSTGGATGTGPAPGSVDYANTINSIVGDKIDFLRQQKGRTSQFGDRLAGLVGKSFDRQAGSLQEDLGMGQANLNRGREKVQFQTANTLKDLSSNIRSALDAGNIKLGVAGASDSSAAPMLNFALAKMQNQNRSNILGQSNQQLADLDLEEQNMLSSYRNEISNLELAKEQKVFELAQDLENKLNAIDAEIQTADAARRQALAELRVDVANEAMQNIQTTASSVDSFINRLSQQASQDLGNLTQIRQQLSQAGENFNPQFNAPQVEGLRLGGSPRNLNNIGFFRVNPRGDEEEQLQ